MSKYEGYGNENQEAESEYSYNEAEATSVEEGGAELFEEGLQETADDQLRTDITAEEYDNLSLAEKQELKFELASRDVEFLKNQNALSDEALQKVERELEDLKAEIAEAQDKLSEEELEMKFAEKYTGILTDAVVDSMSERFDDGAFDAEMRSEMEDIVGQIILKNGVEDAFEFTEAVGNICTQSEEDYAALAAEETLAQAENAERNGASGERNGPITWLKTKKYEALVAAKDKLQEYKDNGYNTYSGAVIAEMAKKYVDDKIVQADTLSSGGVQIEGNGWLTKIASKAYDWCQGKVSEQKPDVQANVDLANRTIDQFATKLDNRVLSKFEGNLIKTDENGKVENKFLDKQITQTAGSILKDELKDALKDPNAFNDTLINTQDQEMVDSHTLVLEADQIPSAQPLEIEVEGIGKVRVETDDPPTTVAPTDLTPEGETEEGEPPLTEDGEEMLEDSDDDEDETPDEEEDESLEEDDEEDEEDEFDDDNNDNHDEEDEEESDDEESLTEETEETDETEESGEDLEEYPEEDVELLEEDEEDFDDDGDDDDDDPDDPDNDPDGGGGGVVAEPVEEVIDDPVEEVVEEPVEEVIDEPVEEVVEEPVEEVYEEPVEEVFEEPVEEVIDEPVEEVFEEPVEEVIEEPVEEVFEEPVEDVYEEPAIEESFAEDVSADTSYDVPVDTGGGDDIPTE